MKLIICEKPSLALNVARALGKFQKKDGYFSTKEYIVSFAFGHLFELKSVNDYFGQKKRWQDVPLPFIPEEFEFKLRKDGGIQKQFKILQKIINEESITEIINCGDADREGQIIIDVIIDNLKTNLKVTRLWLPEQTEETIRKELQNLSSNEKYSNLASEGYARTYLDWILGINLTRHISLKKGTLLRAGRVMIPIVKFIYDRDLEIKNFKPEKYLQLVSETEGIKLEIKEKFKLKDRPKVEEKRNLLNKSEALVSDLKKEKVKK
jgi:DNA topoisomerase-3